MCGKLGWVALHNTRLPVTNAMGPLVFQFTAILSVSHSYTLITFAKVIATRSSCTILVIG
jgi:hypothetical protein